MSDTWKDPIRVLELRSVFGTGGGPEKTILLGTARTNRDRFDITVCYLRADRDDAYRIDQRAKALGVKYVEVGERSSFDPGIWRQVQAIARQARAQIVHAHDYKTNLLAWLLSRRLGTVALSTAHGWTGHSARERRLYYPLDKVMLARFPRVIAVSGEIKRELVRFGALPDRVSVVLNGIDDLAFRRDPSRVAAARSRWNLTDGVTAIGSVGRLEPQKRFDILMQAFAGVRQAHPGAVLLIAGDGSQRQALEAEARRLNLGDACRMLGHVDDVADLHHALDVFVQSSDYEGTPNAVLEAMAFETPTVATAAGGTAEIMRDGLDGLIVPSGDVERLSSGMSAILADRARALGRARSARQRVETELSFEIRMRRVEAIYQQLMASEPRAAAA